MLFLMIVFGNMEGPIKLTGIEMLRNVVDIQRCKLIERYAIHKLCDVLFNSFVFT